MNDELVDQRNFRRSILLALAALTALGALLRYLPLMESLWLDELHTSWVVSGKFSEVAPRAWQGNQSPLYFWGVWAATQLIGQSEFSLRLLSLIAGILLIPAAYVVSLRWSGSPIAALLGAALVATEQQFLFYSTEARPYALVQLVGLLQVALFAHVHACLDDSGPLPARSYRGGPRLFLIASSVVLFYLHYTAALLFVAEAAAFLVVIGIAAGPGGREPERIRSRVAAFFLDFVAIAVSCLPVAGVLWQIAQHRKQWDVLVTSLPLDDLGRVFTVCLAIPLLLAITAGAVRMSRGKRPVLIQPKWNALILTLFWMFLPGLLVVAFRQWANLVLLRYIIASAAAPMVLAALMIAVQVGKRTQIAAAVSLLALAVGSAPWFAALVQSGRVVPDRNEDWRALVAMLNSSPVSKEEPVFVCSGLVEDGRLAGLADREFHEYCLFSVSGIYALDRSTRRVHPIPTIAMPRLTDPQIAEIESAGGAWLVVRGPGYVADQIEHKMLSILYFAGSAAKRRSRHSFGSLTAIWIGVRHQPPATGASSSSSSPSRSSLAA